MLKGMAIDMLLNLEYAQYATTLKLYPIIILFRDGFLEKMMSKRKKWVGCAMTEQNLLLKNWRLHS